jgi:hypothetical protein
MGTFRRRMQTCALLGTFLCISAAPRLLAADEKGNSDGAREQPGSNAVNKVAAGTANAPAPGLTERERMLLDRVEQLEKRVAELEVKNAPAATSAPTTASASTATSTSGSTATSDSAIAETRAPLPVRPEGLPSSSSSQGGGNAISSDRVMASIGPQATEAGKSGAPGTAKVPVRSRFRSRTLPG